MAGTSQKKTAWLLVGISALLTLFASGVMIVSLVKDTPLNWTLWSATFMPGMILLILGLNVIAKLPSDSDSSSEEEE